VAEDSGGPLGYALATTLFSTWHAADILDLYLVHVAESRRRDEVQSALVACARRHAAKHGLAGVRWLQDPGEPAPLFAVGADRWEKLRFTLTTRDSSEGTHG
jgi:hypothetical protein